MLKKDSEKIFELLYNFGSKSELSPISIIFIEPIFDLIFRISILKYSFGKNVYFSINHDEFTFSGLWIFYFDYPILLELTFLVERKRVSKVIRGQLISIN